MWSWMCFPDKQQLNEKKNQTDFTWHSNGDKKTA